MRPKNLVFVSHSFIPIYKPNYLLKKVYSVAGGKSNFVALKSINLRREFRKHLTVLLQI